MRIVLLVVTLAICGVLSASAQEPAPLSDPSGMYRCTGFNPDGSPYSAVVEIRKVDDTYRVLWMLPDDTLVVGVGIISRDVLAVSYFGGSPAVVVYRRDGDRLTGEWTIGGQEGAVYSETLTILPGHPPLQVPTPDPGPRRQQPASGPVIQL